MYTLQNIINYLQVGLIKALPLRTKITPPLIAKGHSNIFTFTVTDEDDKSSSFAVAVNIIEDEKKFSEAEINKEPQYSTGYENGYNDALSKFYLKTKNYVSNLDSITPDGSPVHAAMELLNDFLDETKDLLDI